MFRKIYVCGRKNVHTAMNLYGGEKWAVISITEPPMGDPIRFPGEDLYFKQVRRVVFHDITEESVNRCKDKYEMCPYLMIQDYHAISIAEFIYEMESLDIDTLFVHCAAGISRSAAVARAIEYIHGLEDWPLPEIISMRGSEHPNITVKLAVQKAWEWVKRDNAKLHKNMGFIGSHVRNKFVKNEHGTTVEADENGTTNSEKPK